MASATAARARRRDEGSLDCQRFYRREPDARITFIDGQASSRWQPEDTLSCVMIDYLMFGYNRRFWTADPGPNYLRTRLNKR